MQKEKLLVIGAGVNGSGIAMYLYRAGLDVKILARGKRFDDIKKEGIIIENPFNHKRRVTNVPVINSLVADDIYDYILVVVRKNQALDLIPILAQNKSPNIVFLGNNLIGPEEYISALGKERVLLGTVIGGGKRDGDIIRAFMAPQVGSSFGEIDGTITPRLTKLIELLNRGGIRAIASKNMIDTAMTHAVGVALIGKLTIKYKCDLHAMAQNKKDMDLFVDARREAHQVMRALGHQVIPASEDAIRYIPKFLQTAAMRLLLRSKLGEVGLGYHASQAPDELLQLASELRELVDQSGLSTPAIDQILAMD